MAAFRRAAYALGMAVRESGQALHRAGCRMQGDYRFTEQRMFVWLGCGTRGRLQGNVCAACLLSVNAAAPSDVYCVQLGGWFFPVRSCSVIVALSLLFSIILCALD